MNVRGGVASTSPLGLHTETVEDAMARADSVSGDKWYSGVMLHNKDLRRVVLMVNEYRALTSELAAAKEEIKAKEQAFRLCFYHGGSPSPAPEYCPKCITSERKETERLREALATVGELVRDATNHSSCQDCTVERKMESVHEYIASELAALQLRQGEE